MAVPQGVVKWGEFRLREQGPYKRVQVRHRGFGGPAGPAGQAYADTLTTSATGGVPDEDLAAVEEIVVDALDAGPHPLGFACRRLQGVRRDARGR